MNDFQKQLSTASDPSIIVSKSSSAIPYLGVPVSSKAYQQYPDIASKIDSLAIGTTGVIENKQDNTLNIIRVLSKAQLPDSVQFRQIQIAANTPDEARVKADSIQRHWQLVRTLRHLQNVMVRLVKRFGSQGSSMRALLP